MDLATDGQSLYVARASGRKVIVSIGTRTVATVEHAEALLGEKIAVSPDGQIAVCARTAADMAYACLLGQPWTLLGHSSQPQGLAWVDGRFLCARVHWGEGRLYEQTLDGAVLNSRPCDTSQGILYYDEYLGWVIASNSRETLVGRYRLIKAVRRGAWYCGQAINPDRLVIVKADGSVAFRAGDQPETPVFVVVGDELCCIANDGELKRFRPPYPTTDVAPVPVPVPPPVIPKPEPKPVPEVPDHSAYFKRRCQELGLRRVNGGNNDATRERSFTILNQIASELHAKDPAFGLLEKTSGNRWRDRAIDILTYLHPSGVCDHLDVIGDAEGHDGDPKPGWSNIGPINAARWREPYPVAVEPVPPPTEPQPPTVPQPPTIPLPPVPPVCEFAPCDHSEVNARLTKIENALVALLVESQKPRPVTLSARYLGPITGEIGAPKA